LQRLVRIRLTAPGYGLPTVSVAIASVYGHTQNIIQENYLDAQFRCHFTLGVKEIEAESKQDLRMFHLRDDKDSLFEILAPGTEAEGDKMAYVFDGELASEILKSSDFKVVSLKKAFEDISAKTGLDFRATISVLAKMPLFLNGSEHKKVRGEMAAILAATREEQKAAFEDTARKAFSMKLVDGGSMDIVTDLTAPMFQAFTAVAVGADWTEGTLQKEYPRIMDPIYSLNKRRRVNRCWSDTISAHTDKRVSAEIKLALMTLGNDTFGGSLAISMWQTLDRYQNVALKDIPWPETIPATSLPYADRVALCDWERNGFRVKSGQRVRVVLEASAQYGPLETSDCLFGKGRHMCVGRPAAEMAWRTIVEHVKNSPLIARPAALAYRNPDTMFCLPVSSRIEFHE
jgi:hypothetical protein